MSPGITKRDLLSLNDVVSIAFVSQNAQKIGVIENTSQVFVIKKKERLRAINILWKKYSQEKNLIDLNPSIKLNKIPHSGKALKWAWRSPNVIPHIGYSVKPGLTKDLVEAQERLKVLLKLYL